MILANIAYLFIGLLDGSKQEEKSTLTYVDRSNQPGLKFEDHAFNFYVMTSPKLKPEFEGSVTYPLDLEPEFGSFVLKQKKRCDQYHSDP